MTPTEHAVAGRVSAPLLVPVADHAVLVRFGDGVGDETLARVHALDAALAVAAPAGLVESVPALTTVLVVFDPLVTDHATVGRSIVDNLAAPTVIRTPRHHVLDVCYDAAHAPDLDAAAARCGLAAAEVVDAHVAAAFTVGMFGFAPGFAYLYGTPEPIQLARNPTPGPPVPAGSVIIAGPQCIVTPVEMSTGWFAIGRSAARLLVDDDERPFLFDVCDTVTFRRIDRSELERQLALQRSGERAGRGDG